MGMEKHTVYIYFIIIHLDKEHLTGITIYILINFTDINYMTAHVNMCVQLYSPYTNMINPDQ